MENEKYKLEYDEALELIEDALYHVKSGKLLDIANEYNEYNRYELIYDNDDYTVNDLLRGTDPAECLRMASYGEYDFSDDYVTVDGYGNLKSFNNLQNYLDIDEIASYAIDHNEDFGVADIEEILERYNAEEVDDEDIESSRADDERDEG